LKTVLLIDDDEALRSILTELLRSEGWSVLQAEDGESGLKLTLEHKPDVVVCDLLMPRCNGFQFCRALNARRSLLPNVKIVVSSGSGYAIDRINALESGADEYVPKPVAADELLALLERLTSGKRMLPNEPTAVEIAPMGTTRLKFWGVRGSVPAPGPETVYYGGNTSCVEVRADGELIILDAGTGIRQLGRHLQQEFGEQPMRMTILVTHTHWDHIQGFPFFAPAYDRRNQVRIFAFEGPRKGLEATLSIQMESPYFPISMQEMPGNIEFEELKALDFEIGKVAVKAAFMNHPGVCVGYKLITSAATIAYFPDNEMFGRLRSADAAHQSQEHTDFARKQDGRLQEFITGADIVISDAQYDAAEYAEHVGWGHSCIDDVVDLAMAAKVKQLFLFHHDPDHTDAQIAQMLATARKRAIEAGSSLLIEAAREGLEITFKRKR
jgi:phosphoribosyl 1,2-cyclic phosphodiesterase/ActR/RegA family two-component response regulator